MYHNIIKKIQCSDNIKESLRGTKRDSELCFESLLEKLEKKFDAKLHADNPTDTVNGSLSVLHQDGNHKIIIEFYEKNRSSQSGHATNIHKLKNIPNEKDCKDCLNE